MDYSEVALSIQQCINYFWEGNYFRCSEETQDNVKDLQNKISEREQLSGLDIENILWLLDRYGYKDDIRKILRKGQDTIKTNYDA